MTAPPTALDFYLADEAATQALAARLARIVCASTGGSAAPSGRIHLRGELGAGKTSLVRAFLRAAGVRGRIKSPSYTLLESYKVSNLYFYHFDFYRFSNAHEWRDAGFDELLDTQAILLVEWPEQAGTRLPVPDLDVRLDYAGEGRHVHLMAGSEKGQTWLTQLHRTPP